MTYIFLHKTIYTSFLPTQDAFDYPDSSTLKTPYGYPNLFRKLLELDKDKDSDGTLCKALPTLCRSLFVPSSIVEPWDARDDESEDDGASPINEEVQLPAPPIPWW